jgi:hypothetical protein
MENKKLKIYYAEDVMVQELDAILDKYGDSDETSKMFRDKFSDMMKEEVESIKNISDGKSYEERFKYAIDDGDGVWIYLKVFSIDKLQKVFGTEPN